MSALVERIIAARDMLKARSHDFYSREVLDAMADAANAILGQEALLKAESAARLDLSLLAAEEAAKADLMRGLLTRAREYVTDALDAHEHTDGRDLLKEIDAALRQRGSEPADGSQVEPSTTGTGRHIPLEPNPFIQWNGGENPARGKMVTAKYCNGASDINVPSESLYWRGAGYMPYDIIAYHIIPTDDQGGEGT